MQFSIIFFGCCLTCLVSAGTERDHRVLHRDLNESPLRSYPHREPRYLRPRATRSNAEFNQDQNRAMKFHHTPKSPALHSNPAEGESSPKPETRQTKKGSPVAAGFSNTNQGVAWMKKDGIKTFHNLSAGGSTQQEDHGDKVSAGSYGSRDKPVKTWATGMKTGVSLILKPGSRASVKAIQVDGDSKVFNHDRPGRVKQKFESVIPGHHMHVEAELMGPGQVKSKASQ